MSIEEAILEKVRSLPPEKQNEVLDFTEFLRSQTSASDSVATLPRRNVLGLWANLDFSISDSDISDLRLEMWQNFPRADIE